MEANQPAPRPANWSRGSAQRPATHLPGFCRNQRPPVHVTVTSKFGLGLRLLLVLGLLLQLSTLLLVIAGPVPPRLTPASASNADRPNASPSAVGALSTVPPLSQ